LVLFIVTVGLITFTANLITLMKWSNEEEIKLGMKTSLTFYLLVFLMEKLKDKK